MDISLIICTWNNSKQLTLTLNALTLCEIPLNLYWECIIVNNNSTDDTENVISSFKDRLPIKYVFEPMQGLSRARNAGLKASMGKLIIFGDDDITPCEEWLKIYWEAYQKDPSGYYWGGPIKSNYEKGELTLELAAIAPGSVKGFTLGDKEGLLEKDKFFLAANWACPAGILRDLGGFDISKGLDPSSGKVKTSEETDLMMRLNTAGWRPYYFPKALIKHFVPLNKMTLKHIASRWEAWGEEQAEQYKHYLNHALICKVPRWMLKKALKKWLHYIFLRISGQKWYQAYAFYREYAGILKGLKEIQKAKST